MHFRHSPEIWSLFPELVPGVLAVQGLHKDAVVASQIGRFNAMAQTRLATAGTESELPEIQAWRRAFSRMGLKPTQYRCASESLLRRFRKEGPLPPIHPLIDLCNAASLAYAIPVAVFDTARVEQGLEVRRAQGSETYLGFSGEIEHPEPGEVIFADAQGRAHARRWTHRQSGLSAVRGDTAHVLIVAEALHAGAQADVPALVAALAQALQECWGAVPRSALPAAAAPGFDF
jgi:DNA/RNA-binding domain of Phe-tRNA-synthetase-like protein